MTHALGPVVGNAFQINADAPKPHLRERLATLRYTSAGVLSEDGGKLSFAPNYAGECPVSMPAVYREPAYAPKTDFGVAVEPAKPQAASPEAAAKYEPKAGDRVLVAKESSYMPGKTGVILKVDTDNTSYIRQDHGGCGTWVMTRYLSPAPAEAEFDPMTEPLQVGDEVEVVYDYWCKPGQRDIVTAVRPDEGFICKDSGGWSSRSSLKLIRKAAA